MSTRNIAVRYAMLQHDKHHQPSHSTQEVLVAGHGFICC